MNLDIRMRSVWSIQKENIPWTFPPTPPINRGASLLSKTPLKGEKGYYTRARAPLQRAMPY
jgi:hypothetical protein